MFTKLKLTTQKRFYLMSITAIASFAFGLFSLFIFPSFVPVASYAEETYTVNPSLSISNQNKLAFDIYPGEFNSGSQNITVQTSNYTGYNLTIASANSVDLVDKSNANNTIPTITLPEGASSVKANQFSGLGYGFSLNAADYKPVVNGGSIKTTDHAGEDAFTFTIGAKTESSTPSGAYAKKFTLTAMANDAAYVFTYDQNTTDEVSNMPTPNPQPGIATGVMVLLPDTVPVRSRYDFLGWSANPEATTPEAGAGEYYTLDPETPNQTTLYAVWIHSEETFALAYDANSGSNPPAAEEATTRAGEHTFTVSDVEPTKTYYTFLGWATDATATTPDYHAGDEVTVTEAGTLTLYAVWTYAENTLQGWHACNELESSNSVSLYDARDGSIYTVAKLADDNCWITNNLRLAFSELNEPISVKNTNNPTDAFLSLASDSPAASSKFDSKTIDTLNYYVGNIGVETIDSNGNTYDEYGIYYNWFTATAGNGTAEVTSGEVIGDICPKGWHLPSGNTNGDFYNLNYVINDRDLRNSTASANLRAAPNNFIYSGQISSTSPARRGTYGHYWTSTATNASSAYGLSVNNSSVGPGTESNSKYYGRAIRCQSGAMFALRYETDGGKVTPSMQLEKSDGGTHTFTISETPSYKPGYHFLGWSTQPGASTAQYQPGDSFTATYSPVVLYAVWQEAEIVSTSSFQCSSLSEVGDSGYVRDARDNNVYTVTKLADGNCWMTDNLRLDLSNLQQAISTENTNNPTSDFVNAQKPGSSTNFSASTINDINYNTSYIDNTDLLPSGHQYDNIGVFYNWYTATAGNGTESITSGGTGGDICPKGWHMPSSADFTDLNIAINGSNLMDQTASANLRDATNNFIFSGRFYDTTPLNIGNSSYYWAATAVSTTHASTLNITENTVSPGNSSSEKYNGNTIRCIYGTQYAIHYDANGGDIAPTVDVAIDNSGSHTMTTNPTSLHRSSYRFLGWSQNPSAATADYQPGDTINLSYANSSVNLYAIWQSVEPVNALNFQCSSLANIGDSTFVQDPRDDSIYTVAKLADGHCWMTENLRLDLSNLKQAISTDNTNHPTTSFVNMTKPASSSSWCTSTDSSCTDQILYNTGNLGNYTVDIDLHTYNDYGVYYNWFTATAGNGTAATTDEAAGDLCPLGWHLPSGGNYSEFHNLNTAINSGDIRDTTASINLRNSLNNFSLSGYFYDQSIGSRNSEGTYWSRTVSGASINFLSITRNNVSPGTGISNRAAGRAIRCVANY